MDTTIPNFWSLKFELVVEPSRDHIPTDCHTVYDIFRYEKEDSTSYSQNFRKTTCLTRSTKKSKSYLKMSKL